MSNKKYGLIIPGKNKTDLFEPPKADFKKPSVFGSDNSDSDEDPKTKIPLKKLQVSQIGPGASARRQARDIQQKALAEDPTIFQYDELYDEMETKREAEKVASTTEVKKPKYINRLLQQAEKRKLENERRIERTVQKEREAEGEQFKDKESYVTSGYRQKLEEMRLAEEQEKREDYLEAIGDVRKQSDLGGFYRHLYEQKLGAKENVQKVDSQSECMKTDKNDIPESVDATNSKNCSSKPLKSRTYRKRHSSAEEDEPIEPKDDKELKKAHLQSNLDADSDFSIDSSSSESDEDDEKQDEGKNIPLPKIKQEKSDLTEVPVKENPKSNENDNKEENKLSKTEEKIKIEKLDEEKSPIEKKPKIDIWKKRTVGDVFAAALQRYYERKATRNI